MPPVNDMVQKIAARIVAGQIEDVPFDDQQPFRTAYKMANWVTLERRLSPMLKPNSYWSVRIGDDSVDIVGGEALVIEEALEMRRMSQRDATATRILEALA